MGWLLEALANVFLEILGDLMAWAVNLVGNLQLDIGMAGDGSVPEIGTLIDPTAARGNLLEETFPQASGFTNLFLAFAGIVIGFMFLMSLMARLGGPLAGKSQPAGVTYGRTILAVAGAAYSFSIFVLLESLFNSVYKSFMDKYLEITKDVDNYALGLSENTGSPSGTAIANNNTTGSQYGGYTVRTETASDAYNMFTTNLIKEYKWGQGLGLTIITIALFTILLICFFKLVLEIYERYVMLGVLFYTAPLAFSTIVSKEMSVFSKWVQMVVSEFVVMCSNLFFTGVFISAWHGILQRGTEGDKFLFQTPQEYITTMFLMISWLIIGQQFDQHLKGIGLSTAQTGRGLGGAVMAGLGTAAMAARAGVGAVKSGLGAGYSAATGQTKWQRGLKDPDSPIGAFFGGKNDQSMNKEEARAFLDGLGDPGSKAAKAFDNQSASAQGEQLISAAKGLAGEDNFGRFLDSKNLNESQLNPAATSYNASDGSLHFEDWSGNGFDLNRTDAGAPLDFNTNYVGGGLVSPVSTKEALARQAANVSSLNRGLQGQGISHRIWEADASNPALMVQRSTVDGRILKTQNVDGLNTKLGFKD